jgi:hypothetical protein
MAGTLSGVSCTNLSHNEGHPNNINSSFNDLSKNKSTISLNHYLSHNTKEHTDHSQIPDEFSGPKSALMGAENLS